MSIREIIDAWVRSYNPTDEEKKIAEDRLKICQECPSYRSVTIAKISKPFYVCNDCGCPIPKKIFAKSKESCPKKIWPF